MTTATQLSDLPAIEYPDSDGLRMSDNTLHGRCMITIYGGIEAIYLDDSNVFVAFNLLWYPVEDERTIRIGPDVLVAFGRPKGDRGSYRQWEEGGVAPQVVFEILAPGNRPGEMHRKFLFYQQFGVAEYYIYDPDDGSLNGWRRAGNRLRKIRKMAGFISPRLQIRFEPGKGPDSIRIFGPDGKRFLTYAEFVQNSQHLERLAQAERQRAEEQARLARAERERGDEERRRAEEHARVAIAEHQRAEEQARVADDERQRYEAERQRAERLAARLRELGIDPD